MTGRGGRGRGGRGGGAGRGRPAAKGAGRGRPAAKGTGRGGAGSAARSGQGAKMTGRGGAGSAAPAKRDPLVRETRTPGSPRNGGRSRAAAGAASTEPEKRRGRRRGAGTAGGSGRQAGTGGTGGMRRRRSGSPSASRSSAGGSRPLGSVVSAGAVIFRDMRGRRRRDGAGSEGRRYLVLHYPSGHWDFVKGKVEPGETLYETAVREAREETGITDLEFIGGFTETVRYRFRSEGRTIRKKVVFYLARTGTGRVALSDEHVAYDWLGFKDCLRRATFENAKSVLRRAEDHLLRSPPPAAEEGGTKGRAGRR